MKALKQQLSKESVAGVLFTLPFTIGFLLFMIVPMGISLYYSFCDYDILSPPVFTGLKNFISMFQDETFFKTLKVTFFFAFVSVPLKLLFALIVAMLLLENSKMSGFYRAAYYLPSIIGGSVAVSILWKRMFAMDGVSFWEWRESRPAFHGWETPGQPYGFSYYWWSGSLVHPCLSSSHP